MQNNTQTILIWTVVAIAALAFGTYYFFGSQFGGNSAQNTNFASSEIVDEKQIAFIDLLGKGGATAEKRTGSDLIIHADEIGASVRMEDRDKALAAIELVEQNTDAFPVGVRQRANYNAGVSYSESGDVDDIFDSIRLYKASVEDPETSAKWRARTLNLIATAYCAFGRDPRIVDEVFSTEPYASMLRDADDDPMAAAMAILHWSYDIYPTPRAAILIARGHALEAVNAVSDEERDYYASEAEKWIESADQIAVAELDRTAGKDNDYKYTRRYFSYRHWRTFTVSALALSGVQKYVDTYLDEHYKLFAFMEEQGIENTMQYEPFCDWMLAYFLEKIEGDSDGAKEYLKKAVASAENWDEEVQGTNYFEVFTRNEMGHETMDIFGEMMEFAIDFSPEFRRYVESVI